MFLLKMCRTMLRKQASGFAWEDSSAGILSFLLLSTKVMIAVLARRSCVLTCACRWLCFRKRYEVEARLWDVWKIRTENLVDLLLVSGRPEILSGPLMHLPLSTEVFLRISIRCAMQSCFFFSPSFFKMLWTSSKTNQRCLTTTLHSSCPWQNSWAKAVI